ncbi:MAG: thermonuclease family protein [Patescibacteria group bacterium]
MLFGLFTLLFLASFVLLIVGLINPKPVSKLFRKEFSRKTIAGYFSAAVLVFFILSGASAGPVPKKADPQQATQETTERPAAQDATSPDNNEGVEPATTAVTAKEQPDASQPLYDVTSVTDGDTIKVNIAGKVESIRLIGLDTPEVVDPRKPVQCFGQEASKRAKDILTGKKVRLEADAVSGERDKYNRLLRYVWLEDGTLFNKQMIADGYASEYTYQSQVYKYQSEFKEAEKQARDGQKGLWNPSTCNGDATKPAVTPVPAVTPAPAAQSPTPKPAPAPAPSGSVVKKSKSSICHAPGTKYYDQTTNFTPYNTVDECLNSGGRLPK